MIFTELVLQNFGPYAGRQVINLRPEKDNNPCPIILLGGMNGGGKTTLMDAIRLALYGARAKCSTRNNLSYAEFLSQAVNNQASLIDQARIELAFEGHRWFDLVRTNRALAVMASKGMQSHHVVFPIPQTQIDINPGLIKQNPNYPN